MDSFEQLFGRDKKKVNEGVPIPFGFNSNEKEITCWIAEVNNPRHEKAQRKYSKMLESTRRSAKRHDAVLAKVVAEGILMKWEGMLDSDGNEIEDSIKNKTKQLIKYPPFFSAVMREAMTEDNFMPDAEKSEKDSEKN